MKPFNPRVLLVLTGLVVVPTPSLAQKPLDLSQLPIEELMNIEITSASRKEQRTADVPAAVYVITRDDIHRSGMATIPDLLRLAPGVNVAQINANKWAVSIRGFNGLYANKLLVLVDGRSIYSQIFSGVFWDAQDLMLDDIERIEVIRGPGATMWGANAVNGVINIVTRPAAETLGGLVRVDAGRFGELAAVRYGGTVGGASYRVYSQWTGRDESIISPKVGANDASRSLTTGFRTDWTAQPGAFMVEGAFTAGQTHALYPNLNPQTVALEPIMRDPSRAQEGHLLGRWTHKQSRGASLQLQSFVDIADRQESVGDIGRRVFDVDLQYHLPFGAHQDLVVGSGYRFLHESFDGQVGFALTPPTYNSSLLTAFLQDEITLLGSRLAITLGTQVQYDSDWGAGVQPTARVMWKGLPHQRVWAAVSRALRTPSLYERGVLVNFPPVPGPGGLPLTLTARGNPDVKTESFLDAEGGYRIDIGTTASVDVTGFVGRYTQLSTAEQAAPVVQFVPSPQVLVGVTFGNLLEATTRGLEIAGHWAPAPAWRFDGSYTAFDVTPHAAATTLDATAAIEDGSVPRTQWQMRSAFSPGHATLNAALIHVGPIVQFNLNGYTRADASAEWRFNNRLSAMLIGQNLFDAAHAEFAAGPGSFVLETQVPRSVNLRLRWTF